MHLLELCDFASQGLAKGGLVYLASLDIDGAFDTVPHALLVRKLEKEGVDRYVVRYVATRLMERSFRVRLHTPAGKFYSSKRSISREVPQGGVLSPLLWLIHFNKVHERLAALRAAEEEIFGGIGCMDLIYADDVATLLVHSDARRLVRAAKRNAELVAAVLRELGLNLSVPKSVNLVISPGLCGGSVFRRVPNSFRGSNLQRAETDQ